MHNGYILAKDDNVEHALDNITSSEKIITNIYLNDIDNEVNKKIFEKSKSCQIHFLFEDN